MAIFSSKTVWNQPKLRTNMCKEERKSNRRTTSATKCVQIYADSIRFILTITISIYLFARSLSLVHYLVFGLVFHVVVVTWIQIGKPIIYTSNFGRRWLSYINTYIAEVCIGSKSLKVGMSKHINSRLSLNANEMLTAAVLYRRIRADTNVRYKPIFSNIFDLSNTFRKEWLKFRFDCNRFFEWKKKVSKCLLQTERSCFFVSRLSASGFFPSRICFILYFLLFIYCA